MPKLNLLSKSRRHNKSTKSNDSDITPVSITAPENTMEHDIQMGNKLWNDIKKRVKKDPAFIELNDKEKIEVYQKSEFKDFYISYPIVCRYMICMGQFSTKAFKRFLKKCEAMAKAPQQQKPGHNEEQWIMRQADYVRYLWESYQKQHFSISEAQNIWKHAYDTLKQEFKEFKDMHKEIEEKLKVDEKYNKSELVKELVQRVANEEQNLDENSTQKLLYNLQVKVKQQRRRNLLAQIKNDVPTILPTRVCRGEVKE